MTLIPTPGLIAQVSPAQKAARLAICRACPHYIAKPFERCGHCGCPLASKTRFARATCPIDKWEKP
jgi:hypothetical protein